MKVGNVLYAAFAIAFFWPVGAIEAEDPQVQKFLANPVGRAVSQSSLWRDRGDVRELNLLYGSGGEANLPVGTFTFVKEESDGTSPKFELIDERGNKWKAKLGEETQSETAATRLVWAAGYFTDDDYYLPELRVEKMGKLRRGHEFVSSDGIVRGVRLERKRSFDSSTSWSWFHNAYTGTREMDGLRILMVLINNWDLKRTNNFIHEERGQAPHYVVSDLGATFGRTGNIFTRSKNNLSEYRRTKFIQHADAETVDFHLSSRPFFLTVFYFPNYITRTRMQSVAKDIPRSHAKWIGEVLGRLSPQQIRDCFRAAGYSVEEVEGFAQVVEGRIADLKQL